MPVTAVAEILLAVYLDPVQDEGPIILHGDNQRMINVRGQASGLEEGDIALCRMERIRCESHVITTVDGVGRYGWWEVVYLVRVKAVHCTKDADSRPYNRSARQTTL